MAREYREGAVDVPGFQLGFKDLSEGTEGGVGMPLDSEWYFSVTGNDGTIREFSLQFTTEGVLLYVKHLEKSYFFEDGGGVFSFLSCLREVGAIG